MSRLKGKAEIAAFSDIPKYATMAIKSDHHWLASSAWWYKDNLITFGACLNSCGVTFEFNCDCSVGREDKEEEEDEELEEEEEEAVVTVFVLFVETHVVPMPGRAGTGADAADVVVGAVGVLKACMS